MMIIIALMKMMMRIRAMNFSSSLLLFLTVIWKLVSSPEDLGLSFNTAWLLGHLYNAVTSSSISNTSGK